MEKRDRDMRNRGEKSIGKRERERESLSRRWEREAVENERLYGKKAVVSGTNGWEIKIDVVVFVVVVVVIIVYINASICIDRCRNTRPM